MPSSQRRGATPDLLRASMENESTISLLFKDDLPSGIGASGFLLHPSAQLLDARRTGRRRLQLRGGPFDLRTAYQVELPDGRRCPVLPDGILNRYDSDTPLGCQREGDGRRVSIFAPRAHRVEVLGFREPGGAPAFATSADLDSESGIWSLWTDRLRPGDYYGYRIEGPEGSEAGEDTIFADPWSWAVAKRDDWQRPSLSVVLPDDILDLPPAAHLDQAAADMVIYEAHLRDSTILAPGLPERLRGSYEGVAAPSSPFLRHLGRLGITAVEWLPLADYDYHEPPYGEPEAPVQNTWNPTSVNHWGYMPAYPFAPEARYATGRGGEYGDWIGVDGGAVLQVREMVRRLHEEGYSVLLDVVYNHVAQYGENPIRQVDPYYSLRHDGRGNRVSGSGCGNDLATERPMIRRMIVESLLHWSRFYGVDGFRFDLAGLIDDTTLDTITHALRREHPGVHLIAEPWGGRYDKGRFSVRGWGAWNDHFRDTFRGHHPGDDPGLLFGSQRDPEPVLRGTTHHVGGPYQQEDHSINFLACHDGHTLGDFARIVLDLAPDGGRDRMDDELARLLRLAALVLIAGRGVPMLHQGDEWGRSKTGTDPQAGDAQPTYIRDSYNRDDGTNWIDWSLLSTGGREALVAYVAGLVRLRREHPALRYAGGESVETRSGDRSLSHSISMSLGGERYLVLFNFDFREEAHFALPRGRWVVLADAQSVQPQGGPALHEHATLAARTGILLHRSNGAPSEAESGESS